MEEPMDVVFVQVHVKPKAVAAFLEATRENARHSQQEPGIARFEVYQQNEDPTHFILLEAYRTAEGPARHQGTPHYLKWREAVASMMAEPRAKVVYQNRHPSDEGM
ncbi:MAG: antibiotic biosynthesis monooxygenase [Chloroflexi bacterium]|nr:antibiotic biosynthesis monooxygenase [Chloroflexota bacterium]